MGTLIAAIAAAAGVGLCAFGIVGAVVYRRRKRREEQLRKAAMKRRRLSKPHPEADASAVGGGIGMKQQAQKRPTWFSNDGSGGLHGPAQLERTSSAGDARFNLQTKAPGQHERGFVHITPFDTVQDVNTVHSLRPGETGFGSVSGSPVAPAQNSEDIITEGLVIQPGAVDAEPPSRGSMVKLAAGIKSSFAGAAAAVSGAWPHRCRDCQRTTPAHTRHKQIIIIIAVALVYHLLCMDRQGSSLLISIFSCQTWLFVTCIVAVLVWFLLKLCQEWGGGCYFLPSYFLASELHTVSCVMVLGQVSIACDTCLQVSSRSIQNWRRR
jgi:hypothetical protein